MYKIEISTPVFKKLQKIYKIDKKLYFHLINAVEVLRFNPFRGKRLKGKLKEYYSLRVSDFRIIYTVIKNILTVYIVDLGHRREVYR